MNSVQVQNLYDRPYAEAYDEKFLHSPIFQNLTKENMRIMNELLAPAASRKTWLDLGCGTGYFLSQFPDCPRAGLDLSPAMLDIARDRNPGVSFTQGSFTEDHPEWEGRWDVISSMWSAYGLLDDLAQVRKLLENMAKWCKPDGVVFVHYSNPRLISGSQFPDQIQHPQGLIQIDGIHWSFVEPGNKVHISQVAPTLDWFRRSTRDLFKSMEVQQHSPPDAERLRQVDPEWASAVQAEEAIIFRGSKCHF